MSTEWNKEQIYDEKIAPLMTQIIAICKEHNLPMIALFCYLRQPVEQGGDGYCRSVILPLEETPPAMREVLQDLKSRTSPQVATFMIVGPKP